MTKFSKIKCDNSSFLSKNELLDLKKIKKGRPNTMYSKLTKRSKKYARKKLKNFAQQFLKCCMIILI